MDDLREYLVHLEGRLRSFMEDHDGHALLPQVRDQANELLQRVVEIRGPFLYAEVEAIKRRVSEIAAGLDKVMPLFLPPDEPTYERAFEWRNLWAFWQFVPGTIRPRLLLTLWTFKDWWVIGAVMFLLGSWAPWQMLTAVGAILVLSVAGFLVHELWMRWWGVHVCKLEEVDPHEYALKFTPTFERFVSRYMF